MTYRGTNIFDAHLHIIDKRYPIYENQGYLPDEFTTAQYLARSAAFNVVGGAVVSGSFQKFDQSYLVDALTILGEKYVGVTQLPADTPDETILNLDAARVRAVRFNLRRGGSEDISKISAFAQRIYELAEWHVELYVESTDLADLELTIKELPAVSIDHLGLSYNGLSTLLRLCEFGVKIKASGFGRLDFEPEVAIKEIYAANPNALMFGTDLPSTRAPRPLLSSGTTLVS